MWHGYAKHPDYPDVIVVCGIDRRNEPVYRSVEWPDKFGTNGNGWYYHIEFEGKYQTMGSGVSWSGSLSDERQGGRPGTRRIHQPPRRELVQARAARTPKRPPSKGSRRRRSRPPGRAAEEEGEQGQRPRPNVGPRRRALPKAAGAADSGARSKPTRPQARRRKRKRAAQGQAQEKDKDIDPADLVVLPAVSPLIADKTPVVIDVLVANMLNRPTFLPPETDFATIAAVKIAEHYGFDAAKTTAAARQLSALLQDPDVSKLTPKQRNMALRTQARSLLH